MTEMTMVNLACPHCGDIFSYPEMVCRRLVVMCRACGQPSILDVHLRVPSDAEHVDIATEPQIIELALIAAELAKKRAGP
jgi:hypothetical protein